MIPVEEFHSRIFDFLDDLRAAKYSIGTDDYLRIQGLFVKLASVGQLPKSIAEYEYLIAPIVCTSPDEQKDFATRFRAWLNENFTLPPNEQLKTEQKISAGQKDHSKTEQERRTRIKWIMISLGILMASIIAYVIIERILTNQASKPISNIDPGPVVDNKNQLQIIKLFPYTSLGLTVISVITFLIWYLRKRNLYIRRFETEQQFSLASFFVDGIVGNLFEQSSVSRIARELRRHIPIDNAVYLNEDATIAKTVSNSGLFSPVYNNIMERPEYLVLIDKHAERDHHSKYADSLIDKLISNDVHVVKYYFNQDPRSSYDAAGRYDALTIDQLNVIYPNHRIIIFSPAYSFVDIGENKLKPWVNKFNRWEKVFIVTVTLPENWGIAEQIIVRSGFTLIPENETGLLSVADPKIFSSLFSPKSSEILPTDFLSNSSTNWLGHHAPTEKDTQALFSDLQFYLGSNGIKWLSACAVYPELNLSLTLYLGYQLKDRNGKSLYDHRLLMKLIKLPWFRGGYIPDWLRKFLLDKLNERSQQEIRLVIQTLIQTVSEKRIDRLELTYAVPKAELRYLALSAFNSVLRQKGEVTLSEEIFLTFIDDRLSVTIPRKVASWFKEGKWRRLFELFLMTIGGMVDFFTTKNFPDVLRPALIVMPLYFVTYVARYLDSIVQSDHIVILIFSWTPIVAVILSIWMIRKEKDITFRRCLNVGTRTTFFSSGLFISISFLVYWLTSFSKKLWVVDLHNTIGFSEVLLPVIFIPCTTLYGLILSMSMATFVVQPYEIDKTLNSSPLFWRTTSISSVCVLILLILVYNIGERTGILWWIMWTAYALVMGLGIVSAQRYYRIVAGRITTLRGQSMALLITLVPTTVLFYLITVENGWSRISNLGNAEENAIFIIPIAGILLTPITVRFMSIGSNASIGRAYSSVIDFIDRKFFDESRTWGFAFIFTIIIGFVSYIAPGICFRLGEQYMLSSVYFVFLVVVPVGTIFLQSITRREETYKIELNYMASLLVCVTSGVAFTVGVGVNQSLVRFYESIKLPAVSQIVLSIYESEGFLVIVTAMIFAGIAITINVVSTINIARYFIPVQYHYKPTLRQLLKQVVSRLPSTLGYSLLVAIGILLTYIYFPYDLSDVDLISLPFLILIFVASNFLPNRSRENKYDRRVFILSCTLMSLLGMLIYMSTVYIVFLDFNPEIEYRIFFDFTVLSFHLSIIVSTLLDRFQRPTDSNYKSQSENETLFTKSSSSFR